MCIAAFRFIVAGQARYGAAYPRKENTHLP
jgi:hypothetical protein